MNKSFGEILALVALLLFVALSSIICDSAALYLKTKVVLKALE